MYVLNYEVTIGEYSLRTLDSIEITKSVHNLSDEARIVIPGTLLNRALEVESKIRRGDAVSIWLGYDGNLRTEFEGFLNKITTDDNTIRLECIDSLYLFKQAIADKEYKSINVKELLADVIKQIDPTITLDCSFEFGYSKFVAFKTTGLDVLKKVQDEIKANIYFTANTLHVHPQVHISPTSKNVVFDFSVNVENSNLKYVRKEDKNVEVEIQLIQPNGKVSKETFGKTGGQKITKTLSAQDDDKSLKEVAANEFNLWAYDGFEGDFTCWLIPYVEPGDIVELRDSSYPYKNGSYFVSGTQTTFGAQSGGSRKVTLSRRVG